MTRRLLHLIGVPLLLTAALAGCSKAEHSRVASAGVLASASAGTVKGGLDDAELGRKFVGCMRTEGIDIADPKDGAFVAPAEPAAGADPADSGQNKNQKALEKCREFMPAGGEPPKVSPEDVEKLRAYAKCIRANGVAGFPDPDPATGLLVMDKSLVVKPEDMKKASAACQSVAPDAGLGVAQGNG
jgi:hypothetical protein